MSQGVYVLGGKCPGGKCPGGKCPGGMCPWGKCPGGICPRTVYSILFVSFFSALHTQLGRLTQLFFVF